VRAPVCQYDFTDADLRGHGCALATGTWLAREATDGDAVRGDLTAYASKLRELAGMSLETFRARGTTMTELERAYEAAPGFDGRVAPKMRLMRGVDIRETLLPLLRSPRTYASIAVNYGAVQDAGKGIGSFRGGHNVAITDPDNGKVAVIDPLRRSIIRWDIDLLVKAMETFGSKPWLNGRGEAGVVEYAPTILEYRTQQLDEARAALALARSSLERVAVQLRDQKAQTALAIEERDSARRELAASVAKLAELQQWSQALAERHHAQTAELTEARSDIDTAGHLVDALNNELVAAKAALKACQEAPTPDCLPALKAARDAAAGELEAMAQRWRDEG
jgi:hypothetical protein